MHFELHSRFPHFKGFILLFLQIISKSAAHKFSTLLDGKKVGGQPTTIGELPYLLNLRRSGQFICGSSLITQRCVLTAAHCVKNVPASDLTVRAGASRLSEPGVMRQVEQHSVSPFYSTTTLDMDVAILKLSEPLSGPNISTIALCNQQPASDQFVKISGWGITNEYNNQPPDQVRTTFVQVVAKSDCMAAYLGKALLTSTMFCATAPGERDSCSGDSGGPVVYDGRVCGIVSWGFGCECKEYPGVDTNVASRHVNAFVKQLLVQHCLKQASKRRIFERHCKKVIKSVSSSAKRCA